MLSRPEVGTREHILLWLASRPVDETYDYSSIFRCACAKYSSDYLENAETWARMQPSLPGLGELNCLANSIHHKSNTFGDLYKLARDSWQ